MEGLALYIDTKSYNELESIDRVAHDGVPIQQGKRSVIESKITSNNGSKDDEAIDNEHVEQENQDEHECIQSPKKRRLDEEPAIEVTRYKADEREPVTDPFGSKGFDSQDVDAANALTSISSA